MNDSYDGADPMDRVRARLASGPERALVVGVNDCNCPLIGGVHRYGDGCFTACPTCGSVARCSHDDDEHLSTLRSESLHRAVSAKDGSR